MLLKFTHFLENAIQGVSVFVVECADITRERKRKRKRKRKNGGCRFI